MLNATTAGFTDVYLATSLSVELWCKAEVAKGEINRQRVDLDIEFPVYV